MKTQICRVFVLAALPLLAFGSETESDGRLLPLLKIRPQIFRDPASKGLSQLQIFVDEAPTSPSSGTELCVVSLERKDAAMAVHEIKRHGNNTQIYQNNVSKSAAAGITGGFFATDDNGREIPFGLIKSKGRILNKRNGWAGGGLILWGSSGVSIRPISDYKSVAGSESAVQSRPLIVEHGKNGIHSASDAPSDRSAIALDKSGHVFLFVLHKHATDAGTLPEFSQLILNYTSVWKTEIVDALAMDGGPGAHLYIPFANRHCGGEIETYIPNIVTFGPAP